MMCDNSGDSYAVSIILARVKTLALIKVFNPNCLAKKSLSRGKCLHLSVFYAYFDIPILSHFSILGINRHPILMFLNPLL
jgi:hypothetical protein